ncbi:DUF19 domain-containing protein [Caenorhabditis elegans]|uniref:DUF19 domain-containing protein n=1 Tax=Caenorhabditis elegans TaxID=6239 RepID=O17729_CAEEL|nr:DUF19 domain-containing protein [Caenorhabditis elegans]CAB04023.4 DUF19 domain-containing protein [Caenorhabditis elegans]|eukprot:NP_506492.3 Uncharacterized protein CELE_D1086.6 [Caenorhabditis elegans]
MIWSILITLMVPSVVLARPPNCANIVFDKCGQHDAIRTNPNEQTCETWNKCDDDQKRCVDKTKEVIYTDQICYQFWTPSRDYITWCQSACGIPHVLASNPTEEVCEKWNKCDDVKRQCAAAGGNYYAGANFQCSKYTPAPTVTSTTVVDTSESSTSQSTTTPSTTTTIIVSSTTTTNPTTSTTPTTPTTTTPTTSTTTTARGTTDIPAPPSVVEKWCMKKLQKNNAQFTIDFIEEAESDEGTNAELCIYLNRAGFKLRLEDLTEYCGKQQSDAFKEYVENRKRNRNCDLYR